MNASTALTQFRIARLASQSTLHRAFHWLHLHQLQLRQWQLEMLRIPAPPFGEAARAEWFLQRFRELGLSNVHLDEAGNALAELPGADAGRPRSPVVLLSAHLDTVFPPGTATEPTEADSRILGPGACDNAAGLTGLLGMAAALRYADLKPLATILFAANVGEEGEGDLRGMRHLFERSPYAPRIAAAIALEGSGTTAVVTRALGSRRFRVTVSGPGGHSWTDAGEPNPILILARALLALEEPEALALDVHPDADPRTTLNVGRIAGGTSINSIPESATAFLDLRSTDSQQMQLVERDLRVILADSVARSAEGPAAGLVRLEITVIGNRPGGRLPEDSSLLATVRAVDRHLGLRTEPRVGSTDANIPLSLQVPAIAIGAGGLGGGIHTLQEWYDPTGRETALRRILLTLLDTASNAAESAAL